MPKLIPHIPIPAESNYDLIGLTHTEIRVIKTLLGKLPLGSVGSHVHTTLREIEAGRLVDCTNGRDIIVCEVLL